MKNFIDIISSIISKVCEVVYIFVFISTSAILAMILYAITRLVILSFKVPILYQILTFGHSIGFPIGFVLLFIICLAFVVIRKYKSLTEI